MRTSHRFLSLLTVLLSGALLLSAAGCGSSNPNISSAKDNLENDNYEQALSSIETALSNNPQNAQAYMVKGNILYQQQQSIQDLQRRAQLISNMRDAYDRAIELDPSLQSTISGRLLLAYQQAFQEGVQAYNQAQQQQSTQAYQQAASMLRVAEMMEPDSSTAPLYEAFAYVNAQQSGQATRPLRRAIEAGADSTSNYVLLSQLYQQQQQADSAIALLEAATQAHPEEPALQSELLNAYVRSGQTERAMSAYEEAIRKNPQNVKYRYNYGSMLLSAERYDQAIEQLKKAVDMAPDNASAQFNLGAAYLNKSVGLSDQASALQDSLRTGSDQLSKQETAEIQDRIDQLNQRRKQLFNKVIGPMERARELVNSGQSNASIDEKAICKALYQAYANIGKNEKAQSVSSCAGFEDSE